ncbi:hypothetical protein MMC16_004222 [Acarospora aff. strigata]|nr:hypothetical protein [Acarospora aff. strigata]
MSAAKTKAQKIIDDNAVAVFSKSYCPYCKATKATLSSLGAKPYVIELDQVGALSLYLSVLTFNRFPLGSPLFSLITSSRVTYDGAAIQDALEEMSKQRSVPNIWIKQEHIGGNSQLQERKSELPDLLKEAGAV